MVCRNKPLANNTQFIFGIELRGEELTGLDIIENLDLVKSSTLVASGYSDFDARVRSERPGLKIVPKPIIRSVPLDI